MKENKLALLLIPVLLAAGIWSYYAIRVPELPEDAGSCYAKSLRWMEQNDTAKAKQELERCKTDYPEDGKFDFQLGNIARKQNQMGQALSHYEEAVRKSPQLAEAYNNIAAIHMLENKIDEAKNAIDEGLKHMPEYKDLKFKKGQIHFIKQEYPQAITLLEPLLNDPEFVEAYRFVGIAQLKLNRREEALANLQQYVQKAAPGSPGLADAEKMVDELTSASK
ncbi:tetratricopeptide repeat protein [Paenibacillus sp. HJGM_3]|uniref:tetratricopeptide repeat protein n=1 Tax=Paenibacillus sp. HJGM_3 TaxID=3379816 RepID=UPI0038582EC6